MLSLDRILAQAFLIRGGKRPRCRSEPNEFGVWGEVAGGGVSGLDEEADAGGVGEVAAEGGGDGLLLWGDVVGGRLGGGWWVVVCIETGN